MLLEKDPIRYITRHRSVYAFYQVKVMKYPVASKTFGILMVRIAVTQVSAVFAGGDVVLIFSLEATQNF